MRLMSESHWQSRWIPARYASTREHVHPRRAVRCDHGLDSSCPKTQRERLRAQPPGDTPRICRGLRTEPGPLLFGQKLDKQGTRKMAVITIREALKQALREEMLRDERVFLMGEDIGPYGGSFAVTKGLYEEFGEERVRDTPIAEGVIAGAAVGAAVGGQRPVAEIMTINFALLTLDQLMNHAAKMHHMFGGQWSVPLVVRMAAGWGNRRPRTRRRWKCCSRTSPA